MVHSEVVNGYTIKVYVDDGASVESPLDGNESVILAIYSRRYTNPAERHPSGIDVSTPEKGLAFANANAYKSAQWEVFDLFGYDHSRVVYRPAMGNLNPFLGRAQHAEWDSARAGFIALKKSDYKRKSRIERFAFAEAICEEYSAWANGETYFYQIVNAAGEIVDACGGFIGMESVLDDARAMAQSLPTIEVVEVEPDADNPFACYCDNGHQQNDTVCMYCWNKGRRKWNDPEVVEVE